MQKACVAHGLVCAYPPQTNFRAAVCPCVRVWPSVLCVHTHHKLALMCPRICESTCTRMRVRVYACTCMGGKGGPGRPKRHVRALSTQQQLQRWQLLSHAHAHLWGLSCLRGLGWGRRQLGRLVGQEGGRWCACRWCISLAACLVVSLPPPFASFIGSRGGGQQRLHCERGSQSGQTRGS